MIATLARALAEGSPGTSTDVDVRPDAPASAPTRAQPTPLSQEVGALEARFDAQLRSGAVEDAVGTVMALDELLLEWSRDTEGTGELDRARSAYRSCVHRPAG
jgi:hypothetical protein